MNRRELEHIIRASADIALARLRAQVTYDAGQGR
jgi:hypothetical protein